MKRIAAVAAAIVALSGASFAEIQSRGAVIPPASLSPLAQQGRVLFEKNCARCHGNWGQGGERGPPLIHKIYEPSHHADAAFFFAVTRGSRQHHWRFGNMPPQPQVKPDDIPAIIRFVREVQEANGLH